MKTIIDPGTASVFVTPFSDLHFRNSEFRINGRQLAGGYIADAPQRRLSASTSSSVRISVSDEIYAMHSLKETIRRYNVCTTNHGASQRMVGRMTHKRPILQYRYPQTSTGAASCRRRLRDVTSDHPLLSNLDPRADVTHWITHCPSHRATSAARSVLEGSPPVC